MPKDLVGQLRGWQEKAKEYDEYFNPEQAVDPKIVAAKEKALREARKKEVRGQISRSQQRKQAFLAREAEKKRFQLKKIKITPKQRREMAQKQALMYQMMNLLSPNVRTSF